MHRVDLFSKVGNSINTTRFVFILFLGKVKLKEYYSVRPTERGIQSSFVFIQIRTLSE
jgi:hypothetical protein